ncbi:hypothetical protein [Mycolicibacterium sp. PDY-3]|uniref:hypothetical protein n=1 Tax=Mycolicibacterium sp. PDY-3 TaxID=3376069 RepID=UPI0037AB2C95
MTTLEKFETAYESLVKARIADRNTRQALGGNLPAHKVRKYKQVISDSNVALINAQQKAIGLYKKLNTREQILVQRAGVNL